MRLHSKKGQGTAEYAVVFAVVLAFAIGMQTYVKRALNAHVKGGVDKLVESTSAGTEDLADMSKDAQYEPYYVNQNYETIRNDTYKEKMASGTITRDGSLSKTNRLTGGFQEEKGADVLSEDDAWAGSSN